MNAVLTRTGAIRAAVQRSLFSQPQPQPQQQLYQQQYQQIRWYAGPRSTGISKTAPTGRSKAAAQPTVDIPKESWYEPAKLSGDGSKLVKHKDIMHVIRREQLARLDATGERYSLFHRGNGTSANRGYVPGDVLQVESINSASYPNSTSVFIGVLIAVNHSHGGVMSNFVLRNMVEGVGIEMKFPMYSPLIKSIHLVKKTNRSRRAKWYYLREKGMKAIAVRGDLRSRAIQEAEAAKARGVLPKQATKSKRSRK